jgi:hypothetical protein
MQNYFTNLLFNSNLDLKLSSVSKDAMRFTVESKIGMPRIFLGLLFGVPCLLLLSYALRQQGIYILTALVFCPSLAILSLLFGMTKQKKSFVPSSGSAIKSFLLFNIQREMKIPLPKSGTMLTYKRWSTGGESGAGCYFYHVEIQGLVGFGFCISKDEARRNEFAQDLAGFLRYEIREQLSP